MKNVRVSDSPLDMNLIGERIVALAELAVREHLEAIRRSQADELFSLAARCESDEKAK